MIEQDKDHTLWTKKITRRELGTNVLYGVSGVLSFISIAESKRASDYGYYMDQISRLYHELPSHQQVQTVTEYNRLTREIEGRKGGSIYNSIWLIVAAISSLFSAKIVETEKPNRG
jgi:hypothetical protein